MPINAFPGTRNWGYDGVLPSAVQHSYGGPDGFARFVDAAHRHGLGVVLDVVYNHFGPEGNVLPTFGPYFTDTYDTPWGPAVNVAGSGSDGVRRYFIESAVGWIDDFHVDGLRLDAVHAIVDPTARPMVEELVGAVHRAGERNGRTVLVTLESASNDPRLVRTTDEHGWNADAVWNDDVHHALRVALTGEQHEYYGAYGGAADLAAALEHRWVYRGQYSPTLDRRHGAPADEVDPAHFVVFATNHDHVGNTPRGERMLHGADPADPRRRLAAAFVLLSPFTPLLFMGEEYGETAPFPYFVDHGDPELVEAVRRGRQAEFAGVDWEGGIADPADPATFTSAVLDPSLGESGPHAALLAMYTELIRLRRDEPVITDPDAEQRVVLDGKLLTVIRTSTSSTSVVRFNFSDEPATVDGADLGDGVSVDDAALRFDSASAAWGGDEANGDGLPPFSARLWIGERSD
jgi:maltooligosyltrehalose trehalohydrolase